MLVVVVVDVVVVVVRMIMSNSVQCVVVAFLISFLGVGCMSGLLERLKTDEEGLTTVY